MRIATIPFLLLTAYLASGCAEMPQRPEFDPDYVIERIDGLESRPDWLMESRPFVVENGTVTSLGQTEIPSDHRLEAAYRIAENNAAATISGAIQKKLDFIFQNAEEGTGLDRSEVRFVGGEASRLLTSSMHPGKRYWERIAYANSAGRVVTKYRVFATLEMPEDDFRAAIVNALRQTSQRTGISEEFADKVNDRWDELTSPIAAPEPPLDDSPVTSIEIETPVDSTAPAAVAAPAAPAPGPAPQQAAGTAEPAPPDPSEPAETGASQD